MFQIILSIIEAIYLVYMLNFYKSKTNYSDPNVKFTNAFLSHPITHSDIPISMVCPAGKLLSLLFGTFLIAREFILCKSDKDIIEMKMLNYIVIYFGISMSAVNLNVLLYLSPIFAIEIIRILL